MVHTQQSDDRGASWLLMQTVELNTHGVYDAFDILSTDMKCPIFFNDL